MARVQSTFFTTAAKDSVPESDPVGQQILDRISELVNNAGCDQLKVLAEAYSLVVQLDLARQTIGQF